MPTRIPFVLLMVAASGMLLAASERPSKLIRDGDFERSTFQTTSRDVPGMWVVRNHGGTQVSIQVVSEASNRFLQYANQGSGSHNIHVDQLVKVRPETIYRVRARVRGDGTLEPMIAIQTRDWKQLVTVPCGRSADWQSIDVLFNTYTNDSVRFEWFPGASGRLHTGVAGTSCLDDVRIEPVSAPAPAIIQSFQLQRPQLEHEIEVRHVARQPVGAATPLRRITARDGVLYYADGTEVALWGVNFQTALSWEYHGRLKPLGVPHTADALKKITAENLDHMPWLGARVIRAHLLPADFSGPDGEIRDTLYLDVLDDLLAQCRTRGIYVYLTLMNEMNRSFLPDAFVAGHERDEWIFDKEIAAKSRRYVRAFLQRTNRYTGLRYADDPAIAVIEIMNEPRYPSLHDVRTRPGLRSCCTAFDNWCTAQHLDMPPQPLFATFRYQWLRAYLNEMATVIRDTGCAAPVVWNLNWPRMINGHEDVFQAVADSSVDAVSFCCYPGQSDVPSPFWAHPADLSSNNYLPYLQNCYHDYSYLRWLLGQRFANKAKLAYEFESMYNHSAYLYPAMARLFRALGAQIAPMWQYTLAPVAEFRAGSHYLNAYCTPNKTVSFRIASRVFTSTPRYAPFELDDSRQMVEPNWAVSFEHRLSIWRDDQLFMYSGNVEWNPLGTPTQLGTVVGCGNSPLVRYDGTGMYSLVFQDDHAELRIFPDIRYAYPTWQRPPAGKPTRVCTLDRTQRHTFQLTPPDWSDTYQVAHSGAHDKRATPIITGTAKAGQCRIRPGQYVLRKTIERKSVVN